MTGGSLGGMVALEVALERPPAVGSVLPMAAPAATGALAIAWNGIQVELVRRLGEDGLDLARRLAMTTYRSETDFDHRFGRATEPDGTPSITSYLAYQGRKLVGRFDPETYRVLVGAMDLHDAGAGRVASARRWRGWQTMASGSPAWASTATSSTVRPRCGP